MILESDIENAFVVWCSSQGFLCLKLKDEGSNGFPDRTVILPNGKVVFLEFKRPGGRLSAQQRQWINKLSGMGHDAVCVDNFKDAQDMVLNEL